MPTMTVRIHDETHRSLKEMARETGEAMADILAKPSRTIAGSAS